MHGEEEGRDKTSKRMPSINPSLEKSPSLVYHCSRVNILLPSTPASCSKGEEEKAIFFKDHPQRGHFLPHLSRETGIFGARI